MASMSASTSRKAGTDGSKCRSYVLHLIRLQYLRRTRDPLGPTTITFPETHSPYVLHSDLVDAQVWPELALVTPARPVAASGLSGSTSGLRYADTISNGSSGFGMRVRARQRSNWTAGKKIPPMAAPPESEPPTPTDNGKGKRRQDYSEEGQAPPRVTVGSIGETEIDGEVPTPTATAENRPAIVRTSSSSDDPEQAGAASLRRRQKTDDLYQDALEQPADSKLPDRRSRPVTLLHTPEYAHDKELSDAFRWQDDGPQFEDDGENGQAEDVVGEPTISLSSSPATARRTILKREDSSESALPTTPLTFQALDGNDSEGPVSAATAIRNRRQIRANSEASSFAVSDSTNDNNATPYAAKTEDDYDFMRAASVLEASSIAAHRARSRLNPKPSEPDLQALRASLSPTKMTREGSSSSLNSGRPAPQADPPASSAFAKRRERRRVNISGKLVLPLHLQQPPPLPPLRPRASTDSKLTADGPLSNKPLLGQAGSSRPRSATDTKPLSIRKLAPSTSSQSVAIPTNKKRVEPPFAVKKMPIAPTSGPSALSAMLSQRPASDASENPFLADYGALILRSAVENGLKLRIFFPHATEKKGVARVEVKMRRDVTVEEVIGCALLKYWEDAKSPPLISLAEKDGWDGETYIGRLDPAAWNLRIVEDEDDGDVDDDFPALDRTLAISAFSFGAFALVEASQSQRKQNQVLQQQIQRRPSRIITRPKMLQPPSQTSIPASTCRDVLSVTDDIIEGPTPLDKPPNLSTSYAAPGGAEVYLRIRIPMPGLEAVVSTVKVTTNTYLADVIDTICRKRREHLGDAKDWVLMLGERDIIAPVDRTVESLQGNHNLRLVKKSVVAGLSQSGSKPLANVNPAASIFKRLSEPAQPKYISASDVTRIYKRFTVYRKHAMSLGRHERILCIDGEHLHIMHPLSGAGRTATYHIGNVVDCKQSKRVVGSFKILVYIQQDLKRYDFEAANPRQTRQSTLKSLIILKRTAEIIACVASARQHWKMAQDRL